MTTILVADDEFLIADVLAFALEDEGYTVLTASNGRKALEALDAQPVDLVITDFMMPVMNGLELATAIRARNNGPMPIILMSGAQAEIARGRADLFTAVFDKPFLIDLVVAKVKALIGPPAPH
jgi:two-component system response regulator VicR